MKITVFTSNQRRHNYFINTLAEVATEIFVVQESRTLFPGEGLGFYKQSPTVKKYFSFVEKAERNIFGDCYINLENKKLALLPLVSGDLNKYDPQLIKDFFNSDLYIVFGSSFIKGLLANILVKNKALNIHMGISPYYRGADCNFWALYDDNPNLVGATVHLLSEGLDSGPILYHALSDIKTDPFTYSMSCVKSAFESIVSRIRDGSINRLEPIPQDKSKEVRYSRREEFDDTAIESFFTKRINLNSTKLDMSLYKDPFILQ